MSEISECIKEYANLMGYASSAEEAKITGKNEFLSWESMEENSKFNLIMVNVNSKETRLHKLWVEMDAYHRRDFINYLHRSILTLKVFI